jgi:hypothetical protein
MPVLDMNHPSSNIRTQATQMLLQRLDCVLDQWRKLEFNDALNPCGLEQIRRNLDRSRRQFDSKLFFVVIFGPLKAGKSTLTNTLAGEYVSPAGFGKETTRRPSLVIRDEESGIDQYISTDPEVNHFLSQRRLRKDAGEVTAADEIQKLRVREAFDAVADYLRGIRSKNEFQGRIRVSTLPLNVQSLEQALTQDLTAEPLLTVIRCKGGHLLSHGVAIVDMPGLDGNRSNWRADPIHEWVISRAEFFLFVQSSVAALNNETHDFLKEIIAQSTKPPVWLVQNIFDARPWQSEEKRKKAADDQREEGKRRVIELLNEAPRASLGLNVGLAWDAKSEDQSEWLTQSEFPKFETDLTNVLHAERALIQERNCLEYLHQRFTEAKKQLDLSVSQIAELRNKHQEMRNKLGTAQALLDAVNYRRDWENVVRGEICTIAEAAAKPWLDSLENEVAKLRERHNRKRTGKEVNAELANVAVRVAAEGDNKHFAKPLLLPQYVNLANQYCKSAENDAVACCNQILFEQKHSEMPPPQSPTSEDLPSLNGEPFAPKGTLDQKDWRHWWDGAEHDGHTIIAHLEKEAQGWREQLRTRKDGWVNQTLTDHFATYCEKRRKNFRAHLQRLIAGCDANARSKEEAATATERLIGHMNGALIDLEMPLTNAVESMRWTG